MTESPHYMAPRKRIVTQHDMDLFVQSDTHHRLLLFVTDLNEAVKGCPLSTECDESQTVRDMIGILDAIDKLADKAPPVKNELSRFGNPAFRTFYDSVQAAMPQLHETFGDTYRQADGPLCELACYLGEAWGNRTRIDYGSGHELSFVAWMLCLQELGLLSALDHRALVLRVFVRYMKLMRKLQSQYWQEPAGSHGVWGLDDYHFLPFLFGSSQLVGHKYLTPKSIHDQEIVDMFAPEYMYYACIQFINGVKTASLRWHSPMLDDISGVKRWAKVNEGMVKMYKAEVLGKLPVMQHFMFGSLLPADPDMTDSADDALAGVAEDAGHGHVHGWGDCCGIKVPSAIAAHEAESYASKGLRRLPFD